jgi:hypothetical protein
VGRHYFNQQSSFVHSSIFGNRQISSNFFHFTCFNGIEELGSLFDSLSASKCDGKFGADGGFCALTITTTGGNRIQREVGCLKSYMIAKC